MTFHRTAALAIALAGVALSCPANAAFGRDSAGMRFAAPANAPANAPCSAPESKQCATYQRMLLRIVQTKASSGDNHVTMAKMGRQQLDALIASIN